MNITLLVIPTINEEAAIGPLIDECEPLFPNIMIVDGGSTDRTPQIAMARGVNLVVQRHGVGKGAGVRTAMEEFLRRNEAILCIMDGDGTNIPSDLANVRDIVANDLADVALGSRTRGLRQAGAMDLVTLASNRVVSFLLGAKYMRYFTDVQTGYWAFNRRSVEKLFPKLRSTRFEIELEIFVKAMACGARVREVPVGFRKRLGRTKFSFTLRLRNLYYAFRYLLPFSLD